MRLSRLHIAGFKSFPDRAELGFDEGVTAIVGPNGCGKSNVVDAITWVLGEQSAKSLRGERMEDVIFSGSDARKPTAAAEVRLKLTEVAQAAMRAAGVEVVPDLDDQPIITRDVEIGRRLYRSGESEYLIDGEVCRLRDIHDLLMDSGLGVKAYAVIEQGKIGQILSSRPAERRALIEEAAGVTKYKARRRSAELKLEAAGQNLTRVDDIIFEVETQRGALKRQAARARRYRRLREELRRWEQVQVARRHEILSRDIEAADARLEEARAREAAAALHLSGLDTTLERLRLVLTEAEAEGTNLRERAHAQELDLGRWQQQIQSERQQLDDLGRHAAALDEEVRQIDDRRAPAAEVIAGQRAAATAARSSLEQAVHRVAACEAEYRAAFEAVQGVELESDSTRATVLSAVATLSALAQARDHASAARDRVAVDRERLALEAREVAAEIDRAATEFESASSAFEAARQTLGTLGSDRAAAEDALTRQRADRQAAIEAHAGLQRQVAGLEARLRSLEELEASRATYGDAARFLLSSGGADLGPDGAVADHLQVERTFARAVDALLGETLQRVLASDLAGVRRMLGRVSAEKAGRCGFFVLDEARAGVADREPLIVPPGARVLADVVRPTGPHARALARAIPPALIVDGFDAAERLARTVAVPVATLAGEVFHGGVLVDGGTRQDVRGILEARAEVAALREDVVSREAEVTALSSRLLAFDRNVPAAEAALAALVSAVHEQEKAIVGLEARLTRVGDERARADRRKDVIATELARARDEERAADERREAAVAAIAAHEARQVAAEGELSGVLARLQAAREAAEVVSRRLTEVRTEQAALGERTSALDLDLSRLEEQARELEARLAARQGDVERTEGRRVELSESIALTERRFDEGVAALAGYRSDLRAFDERLAGARAECAAYDQEIRGARVALEAVRGEVATLQVARATAASDLAHLAASAVELLGASLDEVVEAVARMEEAGELQAPGRRLAAAAAPDEDEAEGDTVEAAPVPEAVMTADEVMADLKVRIDRLGPVNMMAIEQFDELESRHTFLCTQRKDLLDSIAQTGEAIRKIDKTTRERFDEAFALINTNFQTTFATLFGGGRAGLVLIDLDNEQESGIDIVAQPPGKRLQNLQLLSGGEKALTAMALMFAIFRHRPSPFCLLDEIDAPLDDANIGRFVEMLQGMQGHTQFILITHNRKTMEIANRLYGVTMEEPGVSKLISVQLN
ncbi:MAG TPA: chromosome segregation protein SMC [Vicinamibacterales bacterium]|nr:chromosome segregation protein SMC [Vicinamibacterales bacterium]